MAAVHELPPLEEPRPYRVKTRRVKTNGREVTERGIEFRFHEGQKAAYDSTARIVAVIAGTQGGKALALDTPIPTPDGFKLMGDLQVGDQVFDDQGQVCRVTKVTPLMFDHDCYRVVFDDGAELIADADHLWLTQTYGQRKNAARRVPTPRADFIASRPQCRPQDDDQTLHTTQALRETLKDRRGASNHSIVLSQAVVYPERDLPIPPYTFGAWLGDGTSKAACIHVADVEIVEFIRGEGVPVGDGHPRANQGAALTYYLAEPRGNDRRRDPTTGRFISAPDSVHAVLRDLGVLGNKHIPDLYQTASINQRWSLLHGLMDTDGYCKPNGRAEFTSTSYRLARDVVTLMRSLGLKPRLKVGRATLNGRDQGPKYRVYVTTHRALFRLSRKRTRQVGGFRIDLTRRYVTAVEPVPSVPVRCIQVDSSSQLYLAGRDYIVTHNTSWGPWWLQREIARCGPGDYIAATATYDLFKLKMLPSMKEVFIYTLGIAKYHAGDQVLELCEHTFDEKTGLWYPIRGKFLAQQASDKMWARIILRSASSEGGLESATGRAAWLDEAGLEEFGQAAWEAVLRRLSIYRGRILITTTPYQIGGWLKREVFDRWRAGDPNIDVIQFPSLINPAFPEEEFKERQRTMAGWKFSMFYKGEFERPAGLIYPDYHDESINVGGHVVAPFAIPKTWTHVLGVDPGPVYYILLDCYIEPATETLFIVRERRVSNQSTSEIVADLFRGQYWEGVSPYSAFYVGGTPDVQARLDWEAAGAHPVYEPPFSDVESGIDRVTMLLRLNRIRVFSTCMNTRDNLTTYRRELDDQGLPTERIHDKHAYHYADTVRYVVSGITHVRLATFAPAPRRFQTYRGDIPA